MAEEKKEKKVLFAPLDPERCDEDIVRLSVKQTIDKLIATAKESGITNKNIKSLSKQECEHILNQKHGGKTLVGKVLQQLEDAEMFYSYNGLMLFRNNLPYFLKYYFPGMEHALMTVSAYVKTNHMPPIVTLSLSNMASVSMFMSRSGSLIYNDEVKNFAKEFGSFFNKIKKYRLSIVDIALSYTNSNDSHATYILVEQTSDEVNMYIYEPHDTITRSDTGIYNFIIDLISRFTLKKSTVYSFANLIDYSKIQRYVGDYDPGYCQLYCMLSMFCILTMHGIMGPMPIKYWGDCIERALVHNFTDCQIMLLTTMFGLATQTPPVILKNEEEKKRQLKLFPREKKRIEKSTKELKVLDTFYRILSKNLGKPGIVQELYLEATNPRGPLKMTNSEWEEAMRIARIIHRRNKDPVKGRKVRPY